MKISVPVYGEDLIFFGNAGHTPFFAIFNLNGTGMFKSFTLDSIRKNPRTDLDDHSHDEGHSCSHDHDDEEHVRQHQVMADVLKDCDYIVVNRACKNTVNSMKNIGVKVVKCDLKGTAANEVLAKTSVQFV